MKGHVIDTTDKQYISLQKCLSKGRNNGTYYYSLEIVKNIIPNVKTDRPWDTLGMRGVGSTSRAIVFLHHNIHPSRNYSWLSKYDDQILVTSNRMVEKWAKTISRKVIFLPLSVDVEYVEQFKTKKTKDACYSGNRWKFKDADLAKYVPDGVDYPPEDLEREKLLKFIAPYKKCYCIGRCAIEAQILGCEVMKCDHRYEPSDFPVLDNKDAAKILQEELDRIDGRKV